MNEPAVVMEGFTKRFGRRAAVDSLDLEVPRGSVFGLLGPNGAGKSTTIKTMLNLHPPSEGRLRVLGRDTVTESLAVRQRVGYLPEEPAYYGWMTVNEIVRFNAGFYDRWDRDLAASLLERLDLPGGRRLRELSRGMKAKVGLVMALGSRPDLLILDDPTSGLDAVVRREFLEAVIGNVQAEGGTVFFSSHLLGELERVADEIAILKEGRLVLSGSVETLKTEMKKLRAVFDGPVPEGLELPGTIRRRTDGRQALLTVSKFEEDLVRRLREAGAGAVEVLDLSLEDIFVETVKGERIA